MPKGASLTNLWNIFDLGKWTGGGSDSWFDYDRLQKYRRLINPENSQKLKGANNIFYLLSVDVGRITCQTVVTVFKVFRHENDFDISLVNIYILGKTEQSKHFSIQALDLKKIIEKFDPLEIVIDGNGLIILAPQSCEWLRKAS